MSDDKVAKTIQYLKGYSSQLRGREFTDADMQAKKLCNQSLREYEVVFTQLKSEYERRKKEVFNGLFQRIRELAVFSNAFTNATKQMFDIHQSCDSNVINREFLTDVQSKILNAKQSFQSMQKNKDSLHLAQDKMSTIEKLEKLYAESEVEDSSCTNSNYDFELGASETKNLWKSHLEQESETAEDRFKRLSRNTIKSSLSPIDNCFDGEMNEPEMIIESATQYPPLFYDEPRF